MKNLIISSLILITLGLSSCGWKSDPLAGQPDSVKQATPPSGQEKPQGDSEEALRILSDTEFLNFSEGQNAQYTFTGMVLIPGATFDLSVTNLDQFPGATFDPATRTFSWTPAPGFGGGTGDVQKAQLTMEIVSHGGGISRRRPVSFQVYVYPAKQVPTIVSVTFDNNKRQMREGEILNFDVVVKDVSSVDADGLRPTLTFAPAQNGSFEASSVVKYLPSSYYTPNPEQGITDKTVWTFHMAIDLTGKDITTSSTTLRMNIIANSRFQIMSAPSVTSINILTSIQNPVVSWTQPQEMTAGTKNSFVYMVFDPRGESEVQQTTVTNCSSIEAHLVCGACVAKYDANMGNVLYCPITWDIPATYSPGGWSDQVNIDITVSAKSKVPGDTFVTSPLRITRYIKILPAPSAPYPFVKALPVTGAH